MTQIVPLSAEARDRAGKGTARQTRRDGRIPAVIYGGKQAPIMISLEKFTFTRVLNQAGFFTHLFDVTVDGATHRVLPRDVQFHPVTDRPIHVDFQRLAPGQRIRVRVPVTFLNEGTSPGLKAGGVLNVVRREVEVLADPDAVPDRFEIDLAAVEIGDTLRWSSIKDHAGTQPVITDRDFVVATIAPPTTEAADGAASNLPPPPPEATRQKAADAGGKGGGKGGKK